MGEKYDHVGKEIARVPYKVERGDNTPPAYASMIVYSHHRKFRHGTSKMKKTAEDYLGQEVTEAVITFRPI
jgi:molecular chaperone DnaK